MGLRLHPIPHAPPRHHQVRLTRRPPHLQPIPDALSESLPSGRLHVRITPPSTPPHHARRPTRVQNVLQTHRHPKTPEENARQHKIAPIDTPHKIETHQQQSHDPHPKRNPIRPLPIALSILLPATPMKRKKSTQQDPETTGKHSPENHMPTVESFIKLQTDQHHQRHPHHHTLHHARFLTRTLPLTLLPVTPFTNYPPSRRDQHSDQ